MTPVERLCRKICRTVFLKQENLHRYCGYAHPGMGNSCHSLREGSARA